jgi:ubiquinone/menaquinone biosynthesis C-methylase UbiE
MADTNTHFAGSIPELYDRYLGPVMFTPYAADLARRVAESATGPVLETACGTGILTQMLRSVLPSAVHLVATDLNVPMLDYARAKLRTETPVEWQQADAAALPFPPASFAVVACQFGVMFVADKQAVFREARRVVKPGGLLAFNVWDGFAQNPYARVAHETIASFFPTDPPQFFTVPYGFHDPEVLRQLLLAQGFSQLHIETVALEAYSPSAQAFAVGLVTGSPVSNTIQARGVPHEPIVQAVVSALARLGGDMPFRSTMQALVVTARAGTA